MAPSGGAACLRQPAAATKASNANAATSRGDQRISVQILQLYRAQQSRTEARSGRRRASGCIERCEPVVTHSCVPPVVVLSPLPDPRGIAYRGFPRSPAEGGDGTMRTSKFTPEQMVAICWQGESGVLVVEVCRQHGISEQTDYR